MSAAILLAVFVVWLIGAVATSAAHQVMGEANPLTIGDCFSGDHALDLILIVIWPVFWPCFLIHITASKIADKAINK